MERIEFEDRILYRPAKGKKVKFAEDKSTYSEIVVGKKDKRLVVEVKE